MKNFLLSFFVLVLSINVFAQLEVKEGSFKEVTGFVNINIDKMYDDNDQAYSVVKVKTENINDKERRQLLFEGDARTFFELEYKPGEVWVYVSYYATYLKISHPDFGSTEFWFPFDMVGQKGYELTLVNKPLIDDELLNRIERLENIYNGSKLDIYDNNDNATSPNNNIEKESFQNKTIMIYDIPLEMIAVHGGTFVMGCTPGINDDCGCDNDEEPRHNVTLSNYYIGKYEVTQELWEEVMRSNPSYNINNRFPVEGVSWNDCQEFITLLNRITNMHFRLPTEAEWEFAARGGNNSKGYIYSGSNVIEKVEWYSGNNTGSTHRIGMKKANELGIYDMSGNVWEWCQDFEGDYSNHSIVNPQGSMGGVRRIIRGGGWNNINKNCRVSDRCAKKPDNRRQDFGLRLVCDVE